MFNYSESNSVELAPNGKARIKVNETVQEVFGESLPEGSLDDYLTNLENHVNLVAEAKGLGKPNQGAFNNVRGAWFEYLFATYAWNFKFEIGNPSLWIVKLPNVKEMDFRELFDPTTRGFIQQLDDSLINQKNEVRLITSNPDFIIIQQDGLISKEYNQKILNMNTATCVRDPEQFSIDSIYKQVIGNCNWKSLLACIGLKTSLRPDRRIQLIHESNIVKSFYAHLKNRYWDKTASIKYFLTTIEDVSNADLNALQTAVTHTIVNVESIPEPTIDGVFTIRHTDDIYSMLDTILKGMM